MCILIAWYVAYKRRVTFHVLWWVLVPCIGGVAAILAACSIKPTKAPIVYGTHWYNKPLFGSAKQ